MIQNSEIKNAHWVFSRKFENGQQPFCRTSLRVYSLCCPFPKMPMHLWNENNMVFYSECLCEDRTGTSKGHTSTFETKHGMRTTHSASSTHRPRQCDTQATPRNRHHTTHKPPTSKHTPLLSPPFHANLYAPWLSLQLNLSPYWKFERLLKRVLWFTLLVH